VTLQLDPAFATEATARRRAADLEEPQWLLDERLDAIARYAELPDESNQLFTTYLDHRAVRFGELEPYAVSGDATAVDDRLPAGTAGFLHIQEDGVVARGLSEEARAAGVVLDSFRNVLRSRPELVRSTIEGGSSLPANDRFAQLTRATFAAGAVLHVPDGVQLQEPIVLRWSVGAPGKALLSRTAVSLGAGARVSLLEEGQEAEGSAGHVRPGQDDQPGQSLWTGTMEVRLGEGASLDVAGEQDFGPSTIGFINRHARLEAGAQLRWALAHVGGQLIKSRIDNELLGAGSGVRQAEIGFGGASQLFDLTSYTRHYGTDTTGDLLSKGIFQDRSRGYFKGLIEIHKSATGTDSFLGEFAMLLDRKARSVAIPSLEIDQPNVRRASHSSSVAPIDEAQVFYLMSRGLSREIARKFIVLGFLEPVVARIPLPEAQERLRELLDQKWSQARPVSAAA
jgi:Fe-S cluster assembly scaffold protein SufB